MIFTEGQEAGLSWLHRHADGSVEAHIDETMLMHESGLDDPLVVEALAGYRVAGPAGQGWEPRVLRMVRKIGVKNE